MEIQFPLNMDDDHMERRFPREGRNVAEQYHHPYSTGWELKLTLFFKLALFISDRQRLAAAKGSHN